MAHYSGPQELGGPGSLNRLNPRSYATVCHDILMFHAYLPPYLIFTCIYLDSRKRRVVVSLLVNIPFVNDHILIKKLYMLNGHTA